MLTLNYVKPSDAGADKDAGPFGDFRRDPQASLLNGELGSRHAVLNKEPHFLELFFLDEPQRIKAFDLSRYLAGEPFRVKAGDFGNSRLPRQYPLPALFCADPQGGNQPYASNNNTSCHKYGCLSRWLSKRTAAVWPALSCN